MTKLYCIKPEKRVNYRKRLQRDGSIDSKNDLEVLEQVQEQLFEITLNLRNYKEDKDMMKMKLNKKIAGATAMLMVSATMLGTSTFAWFTMNKDVTVTGLQTTAKAEDGIVIAAYTNEGATAPAANAFTDNAVAYNLPSDSKKLYPTFTNNGTNWYHNWSKEYNNGQVYGDDGYTVATNSTTDYYYLENKFQIKSITADKAVYVKKVEVTDPTGALGAYDDCVRVLVKMGSTVQIFNKDGTTWTSETAAANTHGSDAITSDVTASATVVNSGIASIGTATTTGTDVSIFVYYDGEDPACKSANIASFDTLTIKVTFTSDQTSITPAAPAGP